MIVEGIPTSGKSSVIKEISELIGKDRVRTYGEPETHVPIMDKPEGLHIEFFKSLLKNAAKSNAELAVFDRFHFTQAHRAKSGIDKYSEIEDLLAKQEVLVVYLQVDDSAIAGRIRVAAEHRDKERVENFQWDEYFKTKGKTYDDTAQHYAAQQRNQMELLKQSRLKSRIFNATHHEYDAIANQVVNDWLST